VFSCTVFCIYSCEINTIHTYIMTGDITMDSANIDMGTNSINNLITTNQNSAATNGYIDSRISTAGNGYLKLDSTSTMAGSLNMGEQLLINLPSHLTDGATKGYADLFSPAITLFANSDVGGGGFITPFEPITLTTFATELIFTPDKSLLGNPKNSTLLVQGGPVFTTERTGTRRFVFTARFIVQPSATMGTCGM
jgi:hypothetical protein